MRRVTLFHSRDFRLANLGWKLLGSRRSRGKFWFVPAAAMKYRPGDPGELIGEGYGQHIFVKSPRRIRKPASEAILRPALVPEKNGTSA